MQQESKKFKRGKIVQQIQIIRHNQQQITFDQTQLPNQHPKIGNKKVWID
jgi:hypothetical protein